MLGPALKLAHVVGFFERGESSPNRLPVPALLGDLSRGGGEEEGPLVIEIACDDSGRYPLAGEWAIVHAGRLALESTRRCLEGILESDDSGARRIAAARALGDLGDAESLPVLVAAFGLGADPDGIEPIDDGLREAAVLAAGKLGDDTAASKLLAVTENGDDLALHATAVHALGLIGEAASLAALGLIAAEHPDADIRQLAQEILEGASS